MKKILALAIVLLCHLIVWAQSDLIVQNADGTLYLQHKVAPKENFYSIGRIYNTSPKEIESFNHLDMNKGLAVGQVIRIPLSSTNFSQTSSTGRPVYYVVGTKEGLYRVSLKNNNVLMAQLRKWNRLSSDNISAGQKLVVGYLTSGSNEMAQNNSEPQVTVAQEEKKEPPVVKQEQVLVNRVEPQKKDAEKKEATPASRPVSNVSSQDSQGGYFKSQFDLQTKTHPLKSDQTASAGIFKTASGWQDAKYYVLIDNVEPGTIIKVVNPTNNKAIYAKVLGEMSGIRQNQGYDVRISNAAASALDVSETDKFIVRVNY